ncbi:MAG: glycine betaine ABC transporter substrate-binding protein [Rubrivivax sp.]
MPGFPFLWRRVAVALLLWLCAAASAATAADAGPLRIGSKRFTEAYILAEVLVQTARPHAPVELKAGLGNTAIVYEALRSGAIDVYPEYTGTIAQEIVKDPQATTLEALRAKLAPLGLGVDVPLGFNDGYGLAVRADTATRLGLARIGDLVPHPQLRLGLSHEFIGRPDGWPGLVRTYGLPQRPTGLDHGLAYEALAGGQIDVIDIYTTDAQIQARALRVLDDDRGHFPRYDAVLLYRLDLPQRHPAAWAALQRLAGRIDERTMVRLNARAEIDKAPFDAIAREFLAATPAGPVASVPGASPGDGGGFVARLLGPDLPRLLGQHLALVLGAVALATALGVPLACWAAGRRAAATVVLGAAGALQTLPSLALLAFAIAALGRIGTLPALLVLALYAVLPILQNTVAGLAGVPAGLKDAARALGLRRGQVLRLVELPLALPVMVAGVRTATTWAVGTATIAAFIGAGGLGERIVTGLALNDHALMLAGALPAAALALAFEGLFALLSRRLQRP